MRTTKPKDTLEIEGNGFRLVVDILGYENPKAPCTSDANWICSRIHLETNGCNAQVAANLTTHDLATFHEELEHMLATLVGSASLETDEEAISLRLEVKTTGAIHGSGEIRIANGTHLSISFDFESDQSFITSSLSQLKKVTSRYPVIP